MDFSEIRARFSSAVAGVPWRKVIVGSVGVVGAVILARQAAPMVTRNAIAARNWSARSVGEFIGDIEYYSLRRIVTRSQSPLLEQVLAQIAAANHDAREIRAALAPLTAGVREAALDMLPSPLLRPVLVAETAAAASAALEAIRAAFQPVLDRLVASAVAAGRSGAIWGR